MTSLAPWKQLDAGRILEEASFSGASLEGKTHHCEKSKGLHQTLLTLRNKRIKCLRKGSKPSHLQGTGKTFRKRKKKSSIFEKATGKYPETEPLAVSYHWGRGMITEKIPNLRIRSRGSPWDWDWSWSMRTLSPANRLANTESYRKAIFYWERQEHEETFYKL